MKKLDAKEFDRKNLPTPACALRAIRIGLSTCIFGGVLDLHTITMRAGKCTGSTYWQEAVSIRYGVQYMESSIGFSSTVQLV
jgi:hypothetical protein